MKVEKVDSVPIQKRNVDHPELDSLIKHARDRPGEWFRIETPENLTSALSARIARQVATSIKRGGHTYLKWERADE